MEYVGFAFWTFSAGFAFGYLVRHLWPTRTARPTPTHWILVGLTTVIAFLRWPE